MDPNGKIQRLLLRLRLGAVAVAIAILVVSWMVFKPLIVGAAPSEERKALELPNYDLTKWHSLPTQAGGRLKPFESASLEAVRQIHGRGKFKGQDFAAPAQDPVAIVLSWIFTAESEDPKIDWETYPFILCDHGGLREAVFAHTVTPDKPLTEAFLHGKHVSPADLRKSPGFDRLLKEAAAIRKEDQQKAHFKMSTEQIKAEDVARRLSTFDSIRGQMSSRLYKNALLNGGFFDLEEKAGLEDAPPDTILGRWEDKVSKHPDPFHWVGLDKVPGSAWFSIGELRACIADPNKWPEMMKTRLAETPQLYIKPDRLEVLREFQAKLKHGEGQEAVDELKTALAEEREHRLQQIKKAFETNNKSRLNDLLQPILKTSEDEKRFQEALAKVPEAKKDEASLQAATMTVLQTIMVENDDKIVKRIRQGVDRAQSTKYHPDDPEFRMLHLDYLESRFPYVYRESLAVQPFPRKEAEDILLQYDKIPDAYASGDAKQFKVATSNFLEVVHDTTDATIIKGWSERTDNADVRTSFARCQRAWAAEVPRSTEEERELDNAQSEFFLLAHLAGLDAEPYPGHNEIELEMLLNEYEPFKWAWIIMLGSMIFLITSMAVDSSICYWFGMALYVASLAVQSAGFYARIVISGRAPVSNMYETVIWVAYTSAIFALILEAIYRRKVIGLAGAVAATLGLVLADQLPLAVDPQHGNSISPLVPVLRSNYWLTIHVLTIVSSYAGGTLAWVLGNIALAMLAFGKGSQETLKTLTQYSYRAIQIAVLLLAAGTFLGGWWAADSWGRFWGWDSKEVGALFALICYVIPLHARFVGWIKDYGMAVSAVLCYAAIMMSWYGINFVVAAGLHSYGFGGGSGPLWVLWVALLDVEWVFIASIMYYSKQMQPTAAAAAAPVVTATGV